MPDDEIETYPPTYAPCQAVRITPYAGDEPDHAAAVTYRFETPLMFAYAYRTRQPGLYASTGPYPYGPAAPGLVGFTAPDSHPDPRTLTPFASALYPPETGAPLAIDAWSKTPGGETLYLLVPLWQRAPLDEHELAAPPEHHLFALGKAMSTREARTWPRTDGAEYHVEWATSVFLSTDTSAPPAVGAPALAVRTSP
ncbi:hypothetical protein ACFWXA_13175 [Streptomyces atroolivaceus]|uniref:hypothetical protein n=1 Tax=Streptomyces atroolivaceus TaxID=66869 RepID=UPI00365B19E6